MKLKTLLGFGLGAVLLAGCLVPSIHPLFTESEYVYDADLIGDWVPGEEAEAKKPVLWSFTADGKQYKLAHTDENGHKATFTAASGKLGTNEFLDVFPKDPLPDSELNQLMSVHLIGAHVFLKVVKTNGDLTLVAMDVDWLSDYLEKNPKAIAHETQDKREILTASTPELQKFIAQFASDNKVFKNEIKLKAKPSGAVPPSAKKRRAE